MSQTMFLQSVICLNTSETGHDEVYIKYSIDGGTTQRYPSSGYHSMNVNDDNPWTVDLELTYNNTVLIQLWDSDTMSDDELGSHTYQADDAQYTEANLVSESNGARYVLVTGSAIK